MTTDSSQTYTRPFHWLYAHVLGYFWLKCDRCGKGYGGHQWGGDAMVVSLGPYGGRCAYCPWCAATRDEWDAGWRERAEARWQKVLSWQHAIDVQLPSSRLGLEDESNRE